jgi:prepilin-type processing-associated H-X9-DG protein
MAAAHLLYVQDWDERFPDWRFRSPRTLQAPESSVYWLDYLQPYLRNRSLLADPSDVAPPLPPGEGTKLAGYALMTWGPSGDGTQGAPYFRWPGPPLALIHARRPAETISMMDGITATERSWGFEARHHGGLNAAFLDGHARWLPRQELYRVETEAEGFSYYRYAAADQ